MKKKSQQRGRALRAVAITSIAGLALTGCAASSGDEGDGVIRVIAQAGGPGESLSTLAKEYSESHSQKVVVDLYDYDAVRERTVLGFTSGKDSYDVVGFDLLWLKQYIDAGYLLPLDERIEKDAEQIDPDDFVPAYVRYATYKDVQYAIPWFGAVYMLYYRTDLLAQAGVSVPETWDEYASAAAAVQEATGVTGTTVIAKRDDPLMCEFWSIASSYGAQIVDNDTSIVDSPEATAALELWKSLLPYAPSDALAADWPAAAAAFAEGKTAMMLNFSDTSDALLQGDSSIKDHVGFAPIPKGPTGELTPNLGGWGLGVSSQSKKADAAFDFIAWATAAQQQQSGLASGGATNRISVLKDPQNTEKYPYFPAALENFENAMIFPVSSQWVDWEAAIAPSISDALSGQATVQQGLGTAQSRLQAILDKGTG